MKQKFTLTGAILFLLLALNTSAQLPNGSTAPNFTMTDINGTS